MARQRVWASDQCRLNTLRLFTEMPHMYVVFCCQIHVVVRWVVLFTRVVQKRSGCRIGYWHRDELHFHRYHINILPSYFDILLLWLAPIDGICIEGMRLDKRMSAWPDHEQLLQSDLGFFFVDDSVVLVSRYQDANCVGPAMYCGVVGG